MAIDMAAKLGLTEDAIMQLVIGEYDRTILQATWSCVNILRNSVDSGTPPVLRTEYGPFLTPHNLPAVTLY